MLRNEINCKHRTWIRQPRVSASSATQLNSFHCSCSGLSSRINCLKVKKSPQRGHDKWDPIGERYKCRAIAGTWRGCTESEDSETGDREVQRCLFTAWKKKFKRIKNIKTGRNVVQRTKLAGVRIYFETYKEWSGFTVWGEGGKKIVNC